MPSRAHSPIATRLLVVAAATLLLLAIPFPALGAKGNQDRVEVGSGPLIASVSPGEPLAFSASFVNRGPGTITHLRFEGTAPGATFVRASAPCVGAGASVSCALGTFKAGHSVTLVFVFEAPASGEVVFGGRFAGDARRGNPNAASDDVWELDPAAIEVNTNPGFFGRWQAAHGSPVTFDPISSSVQTSTVTARPFNRDYAAVVRHSDEPIECSNVASLGGVDLDGFGSAVDMTVADGETGLEVTMRFAKGTVDKKASKVRVVHERDDGTCSLPPKCDGSNAGNCFVAFTKGHGWHKQLVIHVELPHNGRIKGI